MKNHLAARMIVTGTLVALAGVLLIGCTTPATTVPAATSAPPPPPAATTAPTTPPQPELSGDPVRGGLLYDEWWVVIAEDEAEAHMAEGPATDHPLWKTQTTNTRTGADTWRCKECHGWDYKGVDGAYGSGSHQTGFKG